tara:strand:+ start:1430 stop:1690 length:261 start_codon:yes stop_codon:yes gene_type:complete
MAEYQGKKVTLNKPFRLPQGKSKKSGVYVRNNSTGKVNKVTFGDPNMKIRKNNPKARKSYLARSAGIKTKGQKTLSANYWSRKAWK